jgi:hypothetical protein
MKIWLIRIMRRRGTVLPCARVSSDRHGKQGLPVHKALFLALLVGGVALVILGVSASQSLESDFSRFVSGSADNKAIWMLVGGGLLFVLGLAGLWRGLKATA